MSRFRVAVVIFLAFAVAGFVLAQNADPNTAGPTKNDYRLRVIQPMEGATVTGNRIQVVVDTEIPAERDTRQDFNSMPRPDIDVFINDKLQGTMRDTNNVIDIENVPPGAHTLVLLAKNRSGEIIDRKVVHVSVLAPAVPKTVVEQPVSAPPPPAPAYVAPPAPAYEPSAAPAPMAEEKLPPTGTSDPLLAVAGLVLLAGGIAVRRLV
jgi:LPXTG-motif cell wall-anchored protein